MLAKTDVVIPLSLPLEKGEIGYLERGEIGYPKNATRLGSSRWFIWMERGGEFRKQCNNRGGFTVRSIGSLLCESEEG
jgi:hypothetical protein